MRQIKFIKIFLISLYVVFLGFVLFFNTSSVHAEIQRDKQDFVTTVTSGYDDYWVNTQDSFDDFVTRYSNKYANSWFITRFQQLRNQVNYFNYVAIPMTNVPDYLGVGYSPSTEDTRGYVVFVYSSVSAQSVLGSNSDFTYGTFNDYYGGFFDAMGTDYGENMSFNAVKVPTNRVMGIWNYGNKQSEKVYGTDTIGGSYDTYVPLCIFNYYHHIFYDFVDRSNTSGATQITSAINTQTNTIANETQKQTNAITTATQQQTNQFLDTNDTGNETLEVDANVEDKSVNLDNFFMSIYNAFTSASGVITKKLTLTLPNNSSFDVNIRSDMLSNFFENNVVFKVFYQAFWWVALGGYVIFDVKRMYNLVMIGKWDVLHLIDKPTDVVVDLSTGSSGKGGSIY